jgi:fumarate reductase flavoprotein subunit
MTKAMTFQANGLRRGIRRASHVDAEVHVGVAIVGGGACGLTAALMLNDAGVECVVLERDAVPGGSTALSSGFIPAPGTRVQHAHGVTDDQGAWAGAAGVGCGVCRIDRSRPRCAAGAARAGMDSS